MRRRLVCRMNASSLRCEKEQSGQPANCFMMAARHRFYVPPERISSRQVLFSASQAKQIANVLRLHAGDTVYVFDNTGKEYATKLLAVDVPEVAGEITQVTHPKTEARLRLTLVQGLLKGDKIELILQKCTEIGVSAFIIAATARSVPKIPEDRLASRVERWRAIVREAAEQSGRVRVPDVRGIVPLEQAFSLTDGKGIIAWEQEKDKDISPELLQAGSAESLTCFIGPEGGFSDEEVQAAAHSGIKPVSLGARILRAETAAIVTSALLIYGAEKA